MWGGGVVVRVKNKIKVQLCLQIIKVYTMCSFEHLDISI